MLIELASTSSPLFVHGERLSVIGVIFLAMAGAVFLYRQRAGNGPYGRWATIKMTVAFSPILIIAGGIMMIVAVVQGG